MTKIVEVESLGSWRALAVGPDAPAVEESQLFSFRGLRPGSEVSIGCETAVAGVAGEAAIPLLRSDHLRGHIGLVEVRVDDFVIGEIEVVPDKMSEPAYVRLRADLHSTWAALVFKRRSHASLSARLPPAGDLARRIEQPLRSILAAPREILVRQTATRRMTSVRRPTELGSSMVRRGQLDLPSLAPVVARSDDTPERAMVVDTLHRLLNYALMDGDVRTAANARTHLQHASLAGVHHQRPRPTWGMRTDPRYRQVLEVSRLLDRPELLAREGPGSLRWPVQGLSRLYEYWVFLKVLQEAEQIFGEPPGHGYSSLASVGVEGDVSIPAGTTVSYPGPVHVAFEPEFTVRKPGWMEVDFHPYPAAERKSRKATPDVVVYRPGDNPWMLVIDAKYVGRHFIEKDAAVVHQKYGRMTHAGRPLVREVIAVHPHADQLPVHWAGYGHVGACPGSPLPRFLDGVA